MTNRNILQTMNDRIIALEEVIHKCDIILDDLNVPSKTKSGRDLELNARLQWLASYVQYTMDHEPNIRFNKDPNRPLFFSKN